MKFDLHTLGIAIEAAFHSFMTCQNTMDPEQPQKFCQALLCRFHDYPPEAKTYMIGLMKGCSQVYFKDDSFLNSEIELISSLESKSTAKRIL